MGKRILGILAGLLLIPTVCMAEPFAVCGPPTGEPVTYYDMDVDGIPISGIAAEPDGSFRYDCAAYADGQSHTFRLRAGNEWGVSNWTVPLTGGSPAVPSNFGFVSQ